MFGRLKYKLLNLLLNDICRKDTTIEVSMDERLKMYHSLGDIYERAWKVWCGH